MSDGRDSAAELQHVARRRLRRGGPQGQVQPLAGRLLETGDLVFVRGGSLWAVPFERDRLEPVGTPTPMVEGVRVEGGGAVQYTVGDNGTLVYIPGEAAPSGGHALAWAARGAPEQRLVWTPDGQHIVYAASHDGRVELLKKAADGTGEAETLATFGEAISGVVPGSWAPDGATLAITVTSPGTVEDIAIVSEDTPGTWTPAIQTPAVEEQPRISPDGRWFACQADDTGQRQIYVERFPEVANRRDAG